MKNFKKSFNKQKIIKTNKNMKRYTKRKRNIKKYNLKFSKKIHGGTDENCKICCKNADRILLTNTGTIDKRTNYLNVDPNKKCEYYAAMKDDGNFYSLRKRIRGSRGISHCTKKDDAFFSKFLNKVKKCDDEQNEKLKKEYEEKKLLIRSKRNKTKKLQISQESDNLFLNETGVRTQQSNRSSSNSSSSNRSSSIIPPSNRPPSNRTSSNESSSNQNNTINGPEIMTPEERAEKEKHPPAYY